MITPQPESDLTMNTMVIGADIIRILNDNGKIMITENLLKKFLENDSRRSYSKFFETLTFLYMAGIINERGYKIKLLYGYTQTHLF